MKTDSSVVKKWDDIVFEGHNQEYGAYILRKSYSINVSLGALASVVLVLLIAAILFWSSLNDRMEIPRVVYARQEVTLQPPPSIAAKQSSAMTTTPVRVVRTNLPPKVTTKPIEVVVPTNEVIKTAEISTENNEVDSASFDNGLGEPTGAGSSAYTFVEEMPTYPGGVTALNRYIQLKMRYPADAQRMQLEGTVFVSFIVDVNGMVRDVKIARGLDKELDREALHLISTMPRWKPGRQDGKIVPVIMIQPIKFKL